MSRIAATFAALRARRQAALIPYLTAGDPDLSTTRVLARAAAEAGADLLELGVPFSDPMADGPILQRSSARALAAGTSLPRVLELAHELRRELTIPIVLFGYFNPFFRYGVQALARDAAAAGVDGLLCVDLPLEEVSELRPAARAADLDVIALLAPTTPPKRIRAIAQEATGFLYFVSVLGTTGVRTTLPPELPRWTERVRANTSMPIGVGFGVSEPAQASWIAGFADAVIVGSAIARVLEAATRAEAPLQVAAFVASLKRAMRAA